ncbi:hypothetical protein [Mesorhizobium sp. LjNodule214]|uniref:hypothetical protein n=1 Tax=Mesorhizobium sp. LjNodule214 TaxID=3342252 RepID=UPI003ECE72F9
MPNVYPSGISVKIVCEQGSSETPDEPGSLKWTNEDLRAAYLLPSTTLEVLVVAITCPETVLGDPALRFPSGMNNSVGRPHGSMDGANLAWRRSVSVA